MKVAFGAHFTACCHWFLVGLILSVIYIVLHYIVLYGL